MLLNFLLFALGLVLVSIGADKVVEGASAIAKKLRVSDLVIGLTIVAFGTSAPELAVNVVSSIKKNSDIALGNIIGSNIFNILVVAGFSAMLRPIAVKHSTLKKEIPLSLIAALSVLALGNKGRDLPSLITRGDGVVLLCFFAIFIAYVFEMAKKDREIFEEMEMAKLKNISTWLSVIYIIGGLIGLSFGGRIIVSSATQIAKVFGVSDKLIGLTIVAAGTSIPEFATSLVAAIKGKNEIALGNVVGSNIFNIFFILGISAIINPLNYPIVLNADVLLLIAITVILTLFSKDLRLSRIEGALFFAAYIGYTAYLIFRG
ncbi:cation:H+ antiporter [Fervidobacterium changbaicum]|uniref:Calcium/sodium antiporter n=2 Tax=Fervidobacterium TaxID=2422 RepID=A0AAI8CKR2_FERIS|nr:MULTISPECIES: calcium/sodium antiporter [Fervidobacterium]AMW32138.1 calcium/sodium antiporter [Fervidobacterium islandicum]QAV33910.1 sodium:calcium antiporter [Fervidobacterium changbaicum]SDH55556.1 cation:H+ antiporter [Fervidobacterium changbaicum]